MKQNAVAAFIGLALSASSFWMHSALGANQLDEQISDCLNSQGLIAGDTLPSSKPLTAKVLRIADESSIKSCWVDDLRAIVQNRLNSAMKIKNSNLSAREEALAVLKMPANTPDAVLLLRLAIVDKTINDLLMQDPRFHCDAQTIFKWLPHTA